MWQYSPTDYEQVVEHESAEVTHKQVKTGESYTFKMPQNRVVVVKKHDVTTHDSADPQIAAHAQTYNSKLEEQMKKKLFSCLTPVDTTFSFIRSESSSMCLLLAELLQRYTNADAALIEGGSVRCDRLFPARYLYTIGEVFDLYPFEANVTVIEVTGEELLQALENGVSKYPALEGRFPHVSNITFEFDPELPPLRRVNPATVQVGGKPLDLIRKYKFAMTDFIATGGDGYTVFKNKRQLSDPEVSPTPRDLQMQFYSKIVVIQAYRKPKSTTTSSGSTRNTKTF